MIPRRARFLLALGGLLATPLGAEAGEAATPPSVDVPGPGSTIRVDAAAGELEDATVVVRGVAGRLSVHVEPGSAALLRDGLTPLRLVTTRVGGRALPDPLPPLARRASVAGGRPVRLVLRFRVPEGTAPGTYEGRLAFRVDGRAFATRAARVRVFGVQLPARDDPAAFRTLFLIAPQTYVAAGGAPQWRRRQQRGAGDHRPALRLPLRVPPEPGRLGVRHALARRLPRPRGLVPGRRDAHGGAGLLRVQDDAPAARHAALGRLAHGPVGARARRLDGLSERARAPVLALRAAGSTARSCGAGTSPGRSSGVATPRPRPARRTPRE